jgi:hypothetical protein
MSPRESRERAAACSTLDPVSPLQILRIIARVAQRGDEKLAERLVSMYLPAMAAPPPMHRRRNEGDAPLQGAGQDEEAEEEEEEEKEQGGTEAAVPEEVVQGEGVDADEEEGEEDEEDEDEDEVSGLGIRQLPPLPAPLHAAASSDSSDFSGAAAVAGGRFRAPISVLRKLQRQLDTSFLEQLKRRLGVSIGTGPRAPALTTEQAVLSLIQALFLTLDLHRKLQMSGRSDSGSRVLPLLMELSRITAYLGYRALSGDRALDPQRTAMLTGGLMLMQVGASYRFLRLLSV